MSRRAHEHFLAGMGSGLGGSLPPEHVTYNPAVSEKQRRYMGAALRRKMQGQSRAGDPKMSLEDLRDFARKP